MFNGSLGELFKLPKLIAHFTEHRTLNQNIGIFDFLSMHYLGNDPNDKDHDRDMQLPFKKVSSHFSFQIASIPNPAFLTKEKIEVFDSYLCIIFKNNRPKDPALADMFRPPCFA
jgi:hypothetical protein